MIMTLVDRLQQEDVPVSMQNELYDEGNIPYNTVYLYFPYSIKDCSVTGISARTYTGRRITPSVTVKSEGFRLLRGTDYSIRYGGNVNVGKGTATIVGKGVYTGTKTVSFEINPVGTVLKSATGVRRGFRAVWKKQSLKMKTSRITGYQLQYSTAARFKSAKTVIVKGYGSTSKTVSGLKSGKRYYVRVRTYKMVGKTRYYSAWSKSKRVLTRR